MYSPVCRGRKTKFDPTEGAADAATAPETATKTSPKSDAGPKTSLHSEGGTKTSPRGDVSTKTSLHSDVGTKTSPRGDVGTKSSPREASASGSVLSAEVRDGRGGPHVCDVHLCIVVLFECFLTARQWIRKEKSFAFEWRPGRTLPNPVVI
jgi:hypothetical protein